MEPKWTLIVGAALLASQFSLDSTLYLSNVGPFIRELAPTREPHWLYVTQAVLAAIQAGLSLVAGYIAKRVGSIKYCIIFCYLCSVAGNFLYSCSGPGSLDSVHVLVGGKALTGIGSVSVSLIYSYIPSVVSDGKGQVKLFQVFRTAAAVYMALGQVLCIAISYVSFEVNGYTIDGKNGPTFILALYLFVLACVFVVLLDNPRPPKAGGPSKTLKESIPHSYKELRFTKQTICALLLLGINICSAYIASAIQYFLSVFLTVDVGYGVRNQSIALLIALLMSIVGMIALQKLPSLVRSHDQAQSSEAETIFGTQMKLAFGSFVIVVCGLAICVGVWAGVDTGSISAYGNVAVVAGYIVGATLTLIGYNNQASCVPALFKLVLPKEQVAVLMPVLGFAQGVGKLTSPIISSAIYYTKAGGSMGIGFCLILGLLAMAMIAGVHANSPLRRPQDAKGDFEEC